MFFIPAVLLYALKSTDVFSLSQSTSERSRQVMASECSRDGTSLSTGDRWTNRELNPHLNSLPSDFLYHIGYSREDAKTTFGDVKVKI